MLSIIIYSYINILFLIDIRYYETFNPYPTIYFYLNNVIVVTNLLSDKLSPKSHQNIGYGLALKTFLTNFFLVKLIVHEKYFSSQKTHLSV